MNIDNLLIISFCNQTTSRVVQSGTENNCGEKIRNSQVVFFFFFFLCTQELIRYN